MTDQALPNLAAAVEDFRAARRRAALQAITARLTGRSVELLSFGEVQQKLKAVGTTERELREIPLDAIVGSVGRYTDFTRSFLPRRDSDEERWARVKQAVTGFEGLPPIEVYQIGDAYFVLDGNHRVSVARQLGAAQIQAHVTQVHTRVPLSPDDRPEDLILKAEYADFLEFTRLDELRPGADLSLTVPGKYQSLENHIEVHRYFKEMEEGREIPYEQAVGRWYDEAYVPVAELIRESGILQDFPGRTETDLYLWISEHRMALAEELGWAVGAEAAAADLAARFSPGWQRTLTRVRRKFLNAVTPAVLSIGPAPGQWRREQLAAREEDRLFGEILVAVSGEEIGWNALDQALVVARREGARLRGLHVTSSEDQRESEGAHAVQAEFKRRCEAAGVSGELVVEVGNVARKISERARWTDLVVVNLAYPPPPQLLARMSSGFRAMIQRCSRPVLAAPGISSPLDRLLLAYDGSPKAEEALFVATYLAGRWDVPLVVLTVAQEGGAAPEALERARQYLEEHGVQASYVRESGPVAGAVLGTARDHRSELVLMGGYGFRPGLEVVLGGTVDQVLRESRKPVLICR